MPKNRKNIMPKIGEVRYAIGWGGPNGHWPGETEFYCGTQSHFAFDEEDVIKFAREIMESPEDLGDVSYRKDLVFYRIERIEVKLPDDIPEIADPYADQREDEEE